MSYSYIKETIDTIDTRDTQETQEVVKNNSVHSSSCNVSGETKRKEDGGAIWRRKTVHQVSEVSRDASPTRQCTPQQQQKCQRKKGPLEVQHIERQTKEGRPWKHVVSGVKLVDPQDQVGVTSSQPHRCADAHDPCTPPRHPCGFQDVFDVPFSTTSL